MPSLLTKNAQLYFGFMPDSETLNRQIIDAYPRLGQQDFIRRSHFFGGRHENLYIKRLCIPAIDKVLAHAEHFAKEILNVTGQGLRIGFWINDMGPGNSTSEHNHDDNDELLSGVYYVHVPAESGELSITDQRSRTIITPEAGMFVFFSPDVFHSVSVNKSLARRISIGMNFGPAQL